MASRSRCPVSSICHGVEVNWQSTTSLQREEHYKNRAACFVMDNELASRHTTLTHFRSSCMCSCTSKTVAVPDWELWQPISCSDAWFLGCKGPEYVGKDSLDVAKTPRSGWLTHVFRHQLYKAVFATRHSIGFQ